MEGHIWPRAFFEPLHFAAEPGRDATSRDVHAADGHSELFCDVFDRQVLDAAEPKGPPRMLVKISSHALRCPAKYFAPVLQVELP